MTFENEIVKIKCLTSIYDVNTDSTIKVYK